MRHSIVQISVALLLSLHLGCSDDSNNPVKPDLPTNGDMFPSYDYYPPPTEGGSEDRYTPPPGDGTPVLDGGGNDAAPLPPAKCGGSATVALQEVSTGQPDYLALKNTGSAPVNLANFQLVMNGINTETYTFKAGESVAAGKVLYIFEYTDGQAGDVNTGDNIPFYDTLDSNSVALYDPSGNLLDFVAIGDAIVGLPPNASVGLIPWPASYDATANSFQRVAMTGKCPSFKASDWTPKAITRP